MTTLFLAFFDIKTHILVTRSLSMEIMSYIIAYCMLCCFVLSNVHSEVEVTWISSMNPTMFSNSKLTKLLDNGGYAIISAERNPALPADELNLSDEFIQDRMANLSADLTNIYLYSDVMGMYDGGKEHSFLVVLHNSACDRERLALCKLGEKYNQDSIIYVKQAKPVIQQMIYTTGPLKGTYVEGQGYQILSANATDNYSSVQLCSDGLFTFTLNFDFERMIAPPTHETKPQQLIQHHRHNRISNQLRQTSKKL